MTTEQTIWQVRPEKVNKCPIPWH